MNAIAAEAVGELRDVIGVGQAAKLFGLARSSFYYQPVREDERRRRGGGVQPHALSEIERADILAVLHSDVHVDHSPYDVYADPFSSCGQSAVRFVLTIYEAGSDGNLHATFTQAGELLASDQTGGASSGLFIAEKQFN